MHRLILIMTISQIFSARASTEFCPENSLCSPKEAKAYQALAKVIKTQKWPKIKQFVQTNGFPLQFLTPDNKESKPKGVSWNSRCALHNKKERKILKAEAFYTKIAQTKAELFPKAQLEGQSFLAPYDNAPYYALKNKLIYQYDLFEQHQYIAIDNFGRVSLVSKPKNKIPTPMGVPCEDNEQKASLELFSYSICQKIWNDSLKRFQKLRLDWGCP